MSRGTRQQQSQHNNNSGSGSSASQQSVQNSNNNTNIRRGNKTLGWYLGELVPSQSGGGNGNADEANNENNAHNHHQHQMLSGQRKGSLAEESSARCSPKAANRAEDHHHHRNGNNNHNNSTRPSHHHHQNAHSNGNNNMRYRHAHHSAVRSRANSSASASKKPMTASNQNNNNNGPGNQHSGPSKDHQQSQQQQQGSAATDFHRSGGGGGRGVGGKENYWYYDPVSDGYYYEHNGTRGWRKRNARLDAAVHAAQMRGIEEAQQKLEQQKKLAESKAQQQQQQQNVPSLMAAQQLAKLAAPNGNVAPPFGSPMAIKYFDHEGYFYEMASVDGWRRRPPGTTPPNSLASSFGTQPKAPSPIPAGPPALPQRRKVQPLQYQAYQQPPPQLSSALDFQEMLLLAKQQQQHGGGGHRSSTAAHGGSCCAQAAQCCANSAPTCCCTIAAMAAQLVLQKQQQFQLMASMKGGGGGGGAEFGGIGDCCGDHSTELGKSNVRSLLDGISKATAPKPASYATKEDFTVNSNNHNNSSNRFELSRSSLGTGWQFPRENGAKWNPMGIGAAAKAAGCADERTTTTTALTVGSFEEPYEFYSSGDEASSETAPPNPTIMPLALAATIGAHQQNHNGSVNNNNTTAVTTAAASVSSVDEDDRLLEELMMFESGQQRQQPSIAPIGSEALAMMGKAGAEQKRTRAQKRPDSLRLTCPKPIGTAAAYEPISPGEILHKTTAANGKENSHYHLAAAAAAHNNFDVDKFIANLPPMPVNHHESILHQMRNPLRTPMGGAPPLVTEPSTADSPLFTPIFLGKNPWAYRAPENPWAYP